MDNSGTMEQDLTPQENEKLRLLDMARQGLLEVMDSTQVAAYLQFAPRTIRHYQANLGMPSHQVEERGEHRFFKDEVDQWLRLRTVGVDVLSALDALEALVKVTPLGKDGDTEAALNTAMGLLDKAGRG